MHNVVDFFGCVLLTLDILNNIWTFCRNVIFVTRIVIALMYY